MDVSPFNDFVSSLDLSCITGPTPAEDMYDMLEQRDLLNSLVGLLATGGLDGLDGSTPAQRQVWRDGAGFAIGKKAARRSIDADQFADGGQLREPCYDVTAPQLYVLLIKSICAAYRTVDVSAVDFTAGAVVDLYARELHAELADAWQNNERSVEMAEDRVIRLTMQACYIYSYLLPGAMLQ